MRRREAQSLFLLGQRAYGKGVYDKCVKILEKALGNIERGSSLGGEVNRALLLRLSPFSMLMHAVRMKLSAAQAGGRALVKCIMGNVSS